jgi:hypothetical protein
MRTGPARQAGGPGRGAALLAPLLLALCACETGPLPDSLPDFDQDLAWAHLEAQLALGPRPSGSEAIEILRGWLTAELHTLGLEPLTEAFTARTPAGPIPMANVYADLEGRRPDGTPAPVVILAAHFDTKRLPFEFLGANDGASGVAVLLELARCLSDSAPHTITYRFLFLDGEEALREYWLDPDNTYGSRHHARLLRDSPLLPLVRAAVVLDMVGDRRLRLFRESISDPRLLETFFDAARDAGLGAHVNGPVQEIYDDHQSFMALNIPSVDLIDFNYGPDNRYWHTADDTAAHCSAKSLGITGRIVLLGLARLEERWK